MTTSKDKFLDQMKKQYGELNYRWSRERDKFEADLQHEGADVRIGYENKRKEFLKFRKDLKEKIVDLEVAGDNTWEDFKDGAENSWKDLRKAFDKASSYFKK